MSTEDVLRELAQMSQLMNPAEMPQPVENDPEADPYAPRPLPVADWVPAVIAREPEVRLRCFFKKQLEGGGTKTGGASIGELLASPLFAGKSAAERAALLSPTGPLEFKGFCEVRLIAKVETPGLPGDGAFARGDFSSLMRKDMPSSPLAALLFRLGQDARSADYTQMAQLASAAIPDDIDKSTLRGKIHVRWQWNFQDPAQPGDPKKTISKYGYRLGRQVKAADGTVSYLPIATDPTTGAEVRAFLDILEFRAE